MCNYGARGPLSLERLSALPDGRLAYRMKRPSPTGQTHLVFAPVAFLRRLAALVPPPRANLVRYFGVFAPNARVRPRVVPALPPAAPPAEAPSCPVAPEPVRTRRPRRPIPWAAPPAHIPDRRPHLPDILSGPGRELPAAAGIADQRLGELQRALLAP